MSSPGPQPDRAEREAAAWFTQLGNRSVTTQALREFRDWREEPANDAAYLRVEAAWDRTADLGDDPDILRATEAALGRRITARPAWRSGPAALAAMALAVAVVAGAALVTFNLARPGYSTGIGEQRLVVLPDGSRMRLNTDSRVRVIFSRSERRILLARGEAFFEVTHDTARPFVVDAGNTAVRAVGTKFDVRRDPDAVNVTLMEGIVRVRRGAEPRTWTLNPNQQLTIPTSGAAAPHPADAAAVTSWTAGRLIFHETSLSEAIAEVNRYGGHKIELDADTLAGRKINGVFDVGDTEAFVAGVADMLNLTATHTPDGRIRLQPATAS